MGEKAKFELGYWASVAMLLLAAVSMLHFWSRLARREDARVEALAKAELVEADLAALYVSAPSTSHPDLKSALEAARDVAFYINGPDLWWGMLPPLMVALTFLWMFSKSKMASWLKLRFVYYWTWRPK